MYVVHCSDKTYYCGVTTDVKRRVEEHNRTKKGAKYTRPRRPVVLFYKEDHPDRSSAQKSEAAFKKLTRQQKLDYMFEQAVKRTTEACKQ